jgi:AhpD family alkylhydroperoxidase
MSHQKRLTVNDVDPGAYQSILAMERYVRAGTLDRALVALLRLRSSQLNGCAYCLDMHAAEARAAGVEQRRLDILSAWREAPSFFTDREQAVLELTESVTRIGEAGVPDAVWEDVARLFDKNEIVRLLMAICAINVWNRMAISTHQVLPERDEVIKGAVANPALATNEGGHHTVVVG